MAAYLPPPETAAGPWVVAAIADAVTALLPAEQAPTGRPRIVAVDGRSASGKSSLAALLHDAVQLSAIVHTDDIAWHESFFEWTDLLRLGVLLPLRSGSAVNYRPPAWIDHGRAGAITVPAGLDLVIVEGVGAARRALADVLDAVVWVQSDFVEAERRGIDRDIDQGSNGDRTQAIAFWHEWMTEELRFLADDRPWERADLIVAGTPSIPHLPGQIVVAASLLRD